MVCKLSVGNLSDPAGDTESALPTTAGSASRRIAAILLSKPSGKNSLKNHWQEMEPAVRRLDVKGKSGRS
jgi:hypothetical protein